MLCAGDDDAYILREYLEGTTREGVKLSLK
jgi:hypothetical protein